MNQHLFGSSTLLEHGNSLPLSFSFPPGKEVPLHHHISFSHQIRHEVHEISLCPLRWNTTKRNPPCWIIDGMLLCVTFQRLLLMCRALSM